MAENDVISSYEGKKKRTGFEDIPQEWLLMWGAKNLRDAEQLVDVTIIVQGKKIKPCHRVVLAAGSPYFRAMFTHAVVEQVSPEVELKDVDYSAVNSIIDYLYTATVDINDDNAQELLTACSLLQVLGLHGKCRRYIESRLCLQNCIEIYSFAKSLCCKELRDAAFALITRRFTDVITTDAFLAMCKDDVIDVLSADELMVETEERVYEAALTWLAHDVESRGTAISEVFSYIRMTLLEDEFLNECIAQEEMLMTQPSLAAHVAAAQKFKSLLKRQSQSSEAKEAIQAIPNSEDNHASPTQHEIPADQGHSDEANQGENKNQVQTNEEKQNEDFIQAPYFEVLLSGSTQAVKLPLNVRRRAGMATQSLLLFTNGRKTVIFEPGMNRYHCGLSKAEDGRVDLSDDSTAGIDPSMPIMKNAEVFATASGPTYLIGGLELQKTASGTSIKAKVYLFDVERLAWTQRASLPEPRCMMGMGELQGRFCVTGGKGLSQNVTLSDVQVYDFDGDKWERGPDLPKALYGHGCASTRDCLFVIGGKTEDKEIVGTVYTLRSIDDQWTLTSPLQVPRFLLGSTSYAHQRSSSFGDCDLIYVVGGVGEDGALSTVEYLSLTKDKPWKFGEEFPGNRCAQTVTSVNGALSAIGGHVTERTEGHHYESRQKYDVYCLEPVDPDRPLGATRWRQRTSHVRGIAGYLCACTCLRVDPSRIGVNR
uniref:Kelch-like protein 41 n=1 Tax=Phallusia mammillata TaxID=59560 RepID=A0A6F9DGJ9_9ASCI|nr:kelch-like protein 41 [Phallusia mammillata]